MSGVIKMLPASIASGTGNTGVFTPTGAADVPTALADGSDSSYVTYASGGQFSGFRFEMSDVTTLPSGARPYGLQAVVRENRIGNVAKGINAEIRIHNGEYVGNDWTNTNVFPCYTNIATYSGTIENRVNTNEEMNQATLNRLTLEVFGMASTNVRIYEAYINVYYDEAPTAAILAPSGSISNSNTPLVQWTYTDDMQPQVAYQVEYYLGGGINPEPIYKSGILAGAATTFTPPITLDSGQYVVRVAVAQKWPYKGSQFWSPWVYGTFTIVAAPFPQPELHVNEFHGFNEIVVQHNANLMSFAEASGENRCSEWQNISDTSVVDQAFDTWHTGPTGFRITLASATVTARRDVPYTPCARGVAFRASAFFQPDIASAPASVAVGLQFYDRNLNPLTTGAIGDTVAEERGRWVQPVVAGVAPDDGYVQVFVRWSAASHDVHYFDDVQLWMTDPDFHDPDFGRGHLLYGQHQTSPTFALRNWPTAGQNLLQDVDAGTDGGHGTWKASLDCTVNQIDGSQALYGETSISLTNTNTFNMQALRSTAAKISVVQGEAYAMSGWATCEPAITPRSSRLVMRFYDANNTYFTSATKTLTTNVNGTWQEMTLWGHDPLVTLGTAPDPASSQYVIVPANAVYAELALEVIGVQVVGDTYYFDRLAWYKLDADNPQPLGWQEGIPSTATDLGRCVVQYQETDGIDTDWHQLTVLELDPLAPTVTCQDWDIASGVQRNYRAYTYRFYAASNVSSNYSDTVSSTLTFQGTWISLVGGPGFQFIYDGDPPKQEVIDPQGILTPIAGRDFPVVESSNTILRQITTSLTLADPTSVAIWYYMNRQRRPVVLRDGRGRRVRGVPQSVTITDEKFGATVQFTLTVSGDQSIKEQP